MKVQLTGQADDTRILLLRQPCTAISRGILDRYNRPTKLDAALIAKVRNDRIKGCRQVPTGGREYRACRLFGQVELVSARCERPGQTENSVKFSLTGHQVFRLLCVLGQRRLCIVRSIQSTENTYHERRKY
jgi:hypothetical protein